MFGVYMVAVNQNDISCNVNGSNNKRILLYLFTKPAIINTNLNNV